MKKLFTLAVFLMAFVTNTMADNHIVFSNPSVVMENTGGTMTYNGQDIQFYWWNGSQYNSNINNDFNWHAKAVGGIKLINAQNVEVDEMDLEPNGNQFPVKFKGEGSVIVTVWNKTEFNGQIYHGFYVITVPYTGNHVWNFEDFNHSGAITSDAGTVTPNTSAQWVSDWKSKPSGDPSGNQHPITVANPNESAQDGYNRIWHTNAYYIPETAGLLFEVNSQNFGYNGTTPNGNTKLVTWGGRYANDYSGYNPTFVIPKVQGGKYIKVWWDGMDKGGLGANFQVVNLLDLENTPIANPFQITGVNWVKGKYKGGVIVFKVEGDPSERKDVVFKLKDAGWNDLYRIEITDVYSTDMVLVEQKSGYKEVLYNNEQGNIVIPESELGVWHKTTQSEFVQDVGTEVYTWPIKSYMGDGNSLIERAQQCRFEVIQEPSGIVDIKEREWQSPGNVRYYNYDIERINGMGNIKIIQKVLYGNDKYVLDKKETWIAIGTYKQQEYPYTWDFTEYNVLNRDYDLLEWLGDTNANNEVKYGHWIEKSESDFNLENHALVDGTILNCQTNQYEKVHRALFAQGSQLTNGNMAIDETKGLRVKQYYRASGTDHIAVGEEYDGEISVDGTALKFTPNSTNHNLLITIPQVDDGMYVFVKANRQPNVYKGSAKINNNTTMYANASDVGAYPVSGTGDIDLYFNSGDNVEIYSIGVTNIKKPVNQYGYATESRDRIIDHTYTGKFTSNDVNAYIITNYKDDKVTMVETNVIPANTGVVMYKSGNTSAFNAPLFVNACNVTADPTTGNLMQPNLDPDFTLNKISGDYTNFVLTDISYYIKDMTSNKWEGEDKIGFYRVGQSGTLGANKSYLQLPTESNWNSAKGVVFLCWDDEEEITGITTDINNTSSLVEEENAVQGEWYMLDGRKLNGIPTQKGIYLKNGKKVLVK